MELTDLISEVCVVTDLPVNGLRLRLCFHESGHIVGLIASESK